MSKIKSILVFFILIGQHNLFAITENTMKGNITECVYDGLTKASAKLYGEYNLVNGLDHVLVKRVKGRISECMIIDSKFGNAKLANDRKNYLTGDKDLDQMSNQHIIQIVDILKEKGQINISTLDSKEHNKVVKAYLRGDYDSLKGLIKEGKCKKRVFHMDVDQYGKVKTNYFVVENMDDKRVHLREPKAGEKTKYHKKVNDPKVTKLFQNCSALEFCKESKNKICFQNNLKMLQRNPKLFHRLVKKYSTSTSGNTKLNKLSTLFNESKMYINNNVNSLREYKDIAKKMDKRAIAVPALLTQNNKLIMSLKNGAYSGIAVVGIEGGMAYYDFLKGNIYRNEFNKKVIESAIKGSTVGGSEALVMFLLPTPQGLILLGAGVGTYILVDQAIGRYNQYKERRFLNTDDLAVYGIELDSVLDIHDDGILLNAENW